MDNKKRSTLSWSASLAVHATGAVMILVAGFHLATPKGDVTDKTEFVTVDVNTPTTTIQNPPPPTEQAPPPDAQQAEVAKPAEVAPPPPPPPAEEANNDSEAEVPKPFTPTEPDENAAAQAPPPDIADTDAAPEPGSSPTNSPTEAVAPAMSPTNSDTTTAATAPIATGSPTEGMTPSPPVTAAQGGAQGPLIDETKLMEAFGNHKPEYPWMARLRRQQGTVVLRAFVDKDGGVSQVTIEKSSGSQLIDDEAQKTYARWRYQPGLSGQVLKPFKFSLK
jgi:periplasmic protein TonB